MITTALAATAALAFLPGTYGLPSNEPAEPMREFEAGLILEMDPTLCEPISIMADSFTWDQQLDMEFGPGVDLSAFDAFVIVVTEHALDVRMTDAGRVAFADDLTEVCGL